MLLSRPSSTYKKKHAETLKKIARHFAKKTGGASDDEAKPRHAFRPIMNMSSLEICIDPSVYLEQENFDPADFLSGGGIEHRIGSTGNTSNDFAVRYEFTLALAERCPKEYKLRWCFTMLGYFDLVQLICPGKSAKKVGKLMMQDLEDFLGESGEGADFRRTLLENINEIGQLRLQAG